MTTQELHELSPDQLNARVAELRSELADIRVAVMAGSEKNHTKLGVLRREVARAQTVLGAKLH
jgi:ribosomal protein L29